ncbi:MAG: GTPase ObgE [Candidatus Omnitrophota bacterium]
MAFVDEVKIIVKAGDGGKGCESFYRDKYFRHPRPNGGDGGDGGDIVFIADPHIHTLLDYKFKQHYTAERGGHGGSKGKTGHRGKSCELRVPVGTVIRDYEKGLLIRDLSRQDESVIAAKGGKGGRGNESNQTPAPPGPGEQKVLFLELKLIADVGLVGFPNAGKSTLINSISKVRSKIASYPFTTKQPVLGVVEDPDGKSFVVADLPGLIEGAHTGRGLGDRFLKHAERTRVLIHIIDMAGEDGRDPLDDYQTICNELTAYSDQLAVKKTLIVANKMDLPQAQENLKRFRQYIDQPLFTISALGGENLDSLVKELRRLLAEQ